MWTSSWWEILCLLALYCHVCNCQGESDCLPTYSSFGCSTCFRVFNAQSDVRNFEDSHQFCEAQGSDGRLLTFSNTGQIALLSTYLRLNSVNERLWIGMQYIDRNSEPVLVDVNGDDVKLDITFEEGAPQAAVGQCVSIMSGGDSAISFLREECDEMNSFICTTSSIELEITNFTSIPDGYGIRNDQLTFSCQFSPALDAQNVVIEWYRNGALVATTGADEDFIISSFQPSHSGNYSCSVLVMVGNIVLGGAQSVEKSIKLAVPPMLSRPPQNATFYSSRIAYLECGVSNETFPAPNVTWFKDTVPVELGGRNFLSPITKTLLISDISVADSGRYTCVVTNVVGTISHSADLIVLDSQANETSVLLNPMSVTAEVGSNLTFDCVGQDNGDSVSVTYIWIITYRDNRTVNRFLDTGYFTIDNIQFSLNIFGVRCAVGNIQSEGSLRVSTDAHLTLVESAQITGRSSNTNFSLGGTAELWCEFKGTPSPQVQWYFKGKLVSDQHTITTNSSGGILRGMSTLTINNFQFKDIGTYQCVVSNYLQSVHQEFNLCGDADVPDVVTNVEVKTIGQTQVKVYWNPPAKVNSDPSLLRYRVHWDRVSDGTVLTVDNARDSSLLIPFIENGYIISGLDPADQVAVLVVAVSYVGEKRDGVEVAKGQTFGRVPKELPIPLVNRTNNGKDIDVMWNPITPNITAGEGNVHRYDVRYFQYVNVGNSIVVSVGTSTQYKIEGVDEDTGYTVQVRVVVLKSTEPTQTFEFGEWGGLLVPKPVVSSEESDEDDGDTSVIIAIVIIIVCLLLIVLFVGCMLWYGYRRIQRGRYYPAKTERQKGTLRISQNQAIYNNHSTIMTVDNSGLHPSSTNGKCEV